VGRDAEEEYLPRPLPLLIERKNIHEKEEDKDLHEGEMDGSHDHPGRSCHE